MDKGNCKFHIHHDLEFLCVAGKLNHEHQYLMNFLLS